MKYAECPLCHGMVEIDSVTKRFSEHTYGKFRCSESGQVAPVFNDHQFILKMGLDKIRLSRYNT